jgi:hypothetical protein
MLLSALAWSISEYCEASKHTSFNLAPESRNLQIWCRGMAIGH